jgi:hypothetical protein
MNGSFRRLKQKGMITLKHREINCEGVTQFNWHEEGEDYAAVNTAINEPSTSTQGKEFLKSSAIISFLRRPHSKE